MAVERITLDQEPIWEIQSDETIAQYRAFCLYRDLTDSKSLAKVAALMTRQHEGGGEVAKSEGLTVKKAPGVIQRWSVRNRWVERAEAYELHLEERRREERESDIARMEARERSLANVAISGVMRRVMGYRNPDNPAEDVEAMDWSQLTPSEVAQLAHTFVGISRLATGRPTSMIRTSLSFSAQDFEETVNGLIEIFMRHVPADRRSVAAEQARAFLHEGIK